MSEINASPHPVRQVELSFIGVSSKRDLAPSIDGHELRRQVSKIKKYATSTLHAHVTPRIAADLDERLQVDVRNAGAELDSLHQLRHHDARQAQTVVLL